MIPILKVPILILGAWFIGVTLKSPNPPAQTKKGDKVSSTSQEYFEKYSKYWAAVARYGNIGLMLSEAVLLVLLQYDAADIVPKQACPKLPSKDELSSMPSLFIFGVICVYSGGLLRLWCYRTLGKLFTFEISIRPGHKLITDGPYSIVRHPSYLGTALICTGVVVIEASPNSYLSSCGAFAYTTTKWVFTGWVAWLIWFAYSLVVARPPVEDRNLRAVFGEEWEEYRKRVPFKLIPGIV